MLSDRIRHARLAAGLTLDEVAERLATLGTPITKAGLSKYELGKSTPGATFLLKLGRALGVTSAYFLRELEVSVRWVAFRKKSSLTLTRQEEIKAVVEDRVEGQFWLQSTLNVEPSSATHPRIPVRTVEEAESAAAALRRAWELDDLPIESLTQTFEDKGGLVVGYEDEDNKFDGLSGWVNDLVPLAVINTAVPPDRSRYNLAHEIGHMMMECENVEEKEQEQMAHRFGAAFLVPPQVARRELGTKRRQLSLAEIGLLKQKYGLSMQAWIRRALDLNIIDEGHYRTLCMEFARRGWRKREPVQYDGNERPTKLMQLTLRALAEGIITAERAAQLCPDCSTRLAAITQVPPTRNLSAQEMRNMPAEQRDQLLALAAAAAEVDYRQDSNLTDFEAFGEDDLYDSADAR